ncbi:hypothetical protein [Desulforhopalus sp. IMCC35007]|uniref:glutamine amidotransferase-related protein n=1 Tax=Desulforhopalus sp. IMCC35007 TaxID=2569543 RepID=UPI0010AEA942|nr:hypothetical protein FCL48_19360 [Desulforhopalus sp. IMCC35007]
MDTESIEKEKDQVLKKYTGIRSAPGSPFKSFGGALYAITYARLNDIPHLGTCAGFQHAVIELARDMILSPQAFLSINWYAHLQGKVWMSISK